MSVKRGYWKIRYTKVMWQVYKLIGKDKGYTNRHWSKFSNMQMSMGGILRKN